MSTVFVRTKLLTEGIEKARQTLRDEHYPYGEGLRTYEALHEALRLMGVQADSFLKWAGMFPSDEINPSQENHLRMLELTLQAIERTLG